MDKNTILKKVDNGLYIQPCKREDGTDFEIKWQKELEPIGMDLTDIKLGHTFSVDHPAFFRKFDIKRGEVNAEDEWEWKKYQREERRWIRATGKFGSRRGWSRGDSIGLIAKDGTTKDHVYTEVKVLIHGMNGDLTQADIEERKVNGYMHHSDFPDEDAHVDLEFSIPGEIFDNAYRELQEEKCKEVSLTVFVDVFNSEVDRGLRHYSMPREFFIEEEYRGNQLFFSSLVITDLVVSSPGKESTSEGNNSQVTDDPNEIPTSILTTIASNVAQIRFLLIVILILFVLKIFKIL